MGLHMAGNPLNNFVFGIIGLAEDLVRIFSAGFISPDWGFKFLCWNELRKLKDKAKDECHNEKV